MSTYLPVFAETTGTLSNSATQVAGQNSNRKGLIISNNSDTVMTARPSPVAAAATAALGISILPWTVLRLVDDGCPPSPVSLFCAGAAKAYAVYEF